MCGEIVCFVHLHLKPKLREKNIHKVAYLCANGTHLLLLWLLLIFIVGKCSRLGARARSYISFFFVLKNS